MQFANQLCEPSRPKTLPTCMTVYVSKVHKVMFWLMHFGSGSPKRLQCRSNWSGVLGLDLGRLTRAERVRKTTIKTASPLLSYILTRAIPLSCLENSR